MDDGRACQDYLGEVEGGGGAGLPCVSSKYLQVPAENLAGWSGLGMSPLIS